jgi:hypothetical protein
MEKKISTVYKAFVVKDGLKEILAIPEKGGVFGREGFIELNAEILKNLISKSHLSIEITEEKLLVMIKSTETRTKIADIFNSLAKDSFGDDNGAKAGEMIEF